MKVSILLRALMVVVGLIGFVANAQGKIYTISSNGDFAKYFGYSRSVYLQPGDTVQIAGGTYNPPAENAPYETIKLDGINGAPGQWINIVAATGAHVRINCTTFTGTWNGIALNNCSFIRVQGLEIVNGGLSAGLTSHDIQFVNNVIHGATGAGISGNGSQMLIRGNTVYGCCYVDPSGTSGIDFCTPALQTSDNSHFASENGENEQVYDNSYGLIIVNNTVHDNLMKVNEIGFNRPVDGNGIILDCFSQASSATNYTARTLVANNVVYSNGGNGIECFHSSHADIFNNTTYHNATNVTGAAEIVVAGGTDTTDNVLINNLCVAGVSKTGLLVLSDGSQAWHINNFNYGATIYSVGSNDINGRAPNFVNASAYNFKLGTSSPALGTGQYVWQINYNHDGTARGGVFNIGAY